MKAFGMNWLVVGVTLDAHHQFELPYLFGQSLQQRRGRFLKLSSPRGEKDVVSVEQHRQALLGSTNLSVGSSLELPLQVPQRRGRRWLYDLGGGALAQLPVECQGQLLKSFAVGK